MYSERIQRGHSVKRVVPTFFMILTTEILTFGNALPRASESRNSYHISLHSRTLFDKYLTQQERTFFIVLFKIVLTYEFAYEL